MDSDLKKAFEDLEKRIDLKDSNQDKLFSAFQKHHATEAKPVRDMVIKHDKEIYGKRGLLVKFAEMDIRTKIFGGVTGVAFVITIILKVIGKI